MIPTQVTALPAPVTQPSAPVRGTPESDFKGQKVRVMMIEGEPWFVAVDVLRALDLKTEQTANYLRHLNIDEKQLLRKTSPNLCRGAAAWFKYAPAITFISEADSINWSCGATSRKPRRFRIG